MTTSTVSPLHGQSETLSAFLSLQIDVMPKPEVLFVAGLPGSGKTPYLMRLQADGWVTFDDYQANARDNSPRFRAGRRYRELVQALRDGKKCVVADMKFCRPEDRREARNNLEEDVPGLCVRCEFFENDPKQCAENIHRSERSPGPRLAKLAEFAPEYSPPRGATFLPIMRDDL